ncbi:hypothetical protein KVG88_30175 [Pseudomonas sp. SWRI74]|uniref:DUF4852 domain-containing protein n=1 Tax=Pseudomonas azerbaijanoccidentalis TaxID=2842347 RepID=A0ABS6QZK4_9PSED|nr:hypothetical protein [Pseudomonas azerbaijanoccidentalis]MBV4524343.1 hypothetical protein [Pseudomonas azerbaijanoccidentalis]
MSKKLVALALTSSLGLLAGIQSASAGVSLFKDYTYGTPMDKYTRSAGYYDCSNSEYKGRCTDNFDFVGQKFTVALFFREDKLDTVALLAPYQQSLYQKVSDALSKSFNIISLENEKSFMDMVTLRNTATQDDYVKKFTAFESTALATGDLTYSYLEVPETVGYADVDAIMAAAPEDVRRAAVRLVRDEKSSTLIVRFELPNVSLKHASAQADESF